jgi:hypothetical protein
VTSPVGGSGRRGVQSVTGRITGSRSESDAGADAFYQVAKRLKEVGGTGKGSLRAEMMKALKQAAKPLPKAVQDAARDRFPKEGGLNRIMAKRKPQTVTRTGIATAGVRIQDKKTDPRMNAEGRIYHPWFGRPADRPQYVPAVKGYFDDPLRESTPEVRDAVVEVLADYAGRLLKDL